MTLEEKKQALAAKEAEIKTLKAELSTLQSEEDQIKALQGLLSTPTVIRAVSITDNPPTGEKTAITLTFGDGTTQRFSTTTENTLLTAALNAMMTDASASVSARLATATVKLDALIL